MKKYENFASKLRVLERAGSEDLNNDASHIYNEEAARTLAGNILNKYIFEFQKTESALKEQYGDMLIK